MAPGLPLRHVRQLSLLAPPGERSPALSALCPAHCLQVALVMRWNVAVGIPDIWFALGDSAVSHFINAVSYMPTLIMVSALSLSLDSHCWF